jgi:hypothetical protein
VPSPEVVRIVCRNFFGKMHHLRRVNEQEKYSAQSLNKAIEAFEQQTYLKSSVEWSLCVEKCHAKYCTDEVEWRLIKLVVRDNSWSILNANCRDKATYR